jgi:hypothetical protein
MVIKNIMLSMLVSFMCVTQMMYADIPVEVAARIKSARSLAQALGPDVLESQFDSVYRKLMLKIHPDKNPEQAVLANELSKKVSDLRMSFLSDRESVGSKRTRSAADYEDEDNSSEDGRSFASGYSQASTSFEFFSAADLLREIRTGQSSLNLNFAITCRKKLPTWQRGEGVSALLYALAHNNCRAVMSIIESGIRVDNEDLVPAPLFYALKQPVGSPNHMLLIELMLRRGANPCAVSDIPHYLDHNNFAVSAEVREHAVHGLTPVHYAAHTSNGLVVADLLAAVEAQGLALPGCDSDGRTPLHYAAIKGDAESVWALLRAGYDKDVNTKDKYEKSPLKYAVEAGHVGCIALMAAEDDEL